MMQAVRAMIVSVGVMVKFVPANGGPEESVPVLLTDQPSQGDGGRSTNGRGSRVALVRVSKQDVPVLLYRDSFIEDDGTCWAVVDQNRITNDRSAGTWRAIVETAAKGRF